ncbi:MAG TPA: EAL domain-containing protein [Acidimicrobiales bacterium]
MRRRRLGLLGRFAVLSAVLIAALGVLLGAALHRSIQDRAVANAIRTGAVAASGIHAVVRPGDLERDFVRLEPERVEALDDALSDLSDSGIVRVKLWNRQHWLVYSDDPDLVGRWFPSTDLLDSTFADGRIGSEITDLTAPEERAEQDFGTLLAVYVPLRVDGEVVGAIEVYLPYAPVAAAIAEDSRDLYLALGAGLLVLYAALFRLVASVSRRLQRQAEENLRQANHDGLTGLPNRGLFTDRLENALAMAGRQGTGLAVVLVDLDGFKDINDALGHHSGDEILCELAQRLQDRLRAGDTVARLGGDGFGFLLPSAATDADAVAVATDVRDLLEEPFLVNGMAVHLAASFGVACYPDHGLDAGELVRHADVAMHAAKTTNTVIEVYGPQFVDPHSAERLELAAEVRRALDEEELELWYQPKMDLIDGHIAGVEALLRWSHPTRGIVTPGLFMPVVETTELARTVTAFVLKEAVAQCTRWKLAGRDLTVAVNLPARNAHDLRLPGQVADLLAAHQLPASALECELTESAVLDHPDRARQVLTELDRLGVHLSIDDFGTGYASLAYLTDLPIHTLKIDQSFVRDVLHGGDGAAIVRFSTDLARMLGLKVVAEGVESREVLAVVADLGCDMAQGYLLTEPLPAAELEAWLDAFDPQTLTLPREPAPA